jgi:hypothetical protein
MRKTAMKAMYGHGYPRKEITDYIEGHDCTVSQMVNANNKK